MTSDPKLAVIAALALAITYLSTTYRKNFLLLPPRKSKRAFRRPHIPTPRASC